MKSHYPCSFVFISYLGISFDRLDTSKRIHEKTRQNTTAACKNSNQFNFKRFFLAKIRIGNEIMMCFFFRKKKLIKKFETFQTISASTG